VSSGILKVCRFCGSRLARVERTLSEKFSKTYVYDCTECGERQSTGTWFNKSSANASCPSCGSFRVSRRRSPDPIDPIYTTLFSFWKRWFGASLFRCRYCRIQFYDFRPLRETASAESQFTYIYKGEPPV
jgi:DNA-directed RNA polymerase subunit RPC12/RpoP